MPTKITVKAPSSTANLGPGFDVFGLALNAFHDEVTLTRQDSGINITTDGGVPTKPTDNTAGLVVKNAKRKFKIRDGVKIDIKKRVPAGFGMGSSAASAAAAAVAVDRLFELGLDSDALVELAGSGEKASAGTIHYDNVAASVLGGFVIVRDNPLSVIRIKPPQSLRMCVAVPSIIVPKKKTQASRNVIPTMINLKDSITNLSSAASIVAGFASGNSHMIGSSIRDVVVEPARQHMIPGFASVKRNALKAGATGVAISGAGPSVIAFSEKGADMNEIAAAMSKGFASAKTRCQTILCRPSMGAIVRR